MRHYGAVRKRVRDLLAEYNDEIEVLLVCLELAKRDRERFTPWGSLNAGSFAYISDQFNVPPGAFFWHLWLQEEIKLDQRPRDPVRRGLALWIDEWQDGLKAYDEARVRNAKMMLERLWSNFGPGSASPPPSLGLASVDSAERARLKARGGDDMT
jgi:hypothetical protein